MLTTIWIVQIITAVLLIMLVLLHSPKSGGIGALDGGSSIFSSQKSAEKGLNKLTGIVSAVFLICTFLLGFGIIK